MIVIDLSLWSANSGLKSSRGIITISNTRQYRDGNHTYADYVAKAFPKGTSMTAASLHASKPHRQASIYRHPKHAKPAWSLISKALKELGYAE